MMKQNFFNKFLIISSFLVNTICLILVLTGKYDGNILVILSYYGLLLIPFIIKKFKIELPSLIETIYFVFIIVACLLGSVLKFYGIIYWFDSFVHYISGMLTAVLAFIILIKLGKFKDKDLAFNILFMILVTLSVAVLWEMFEFTADNLLGGDAQKVLETGVTDTMKDMICAFLGSCLISIMYIFEKINNKKMLISKFINRLS